MIYQLLSLLFILSCTTSKVKTDKKVTITFSPEQYCLEGHPMACYVYGMDLLAKNEKEKAIELFDKSCKKNIMGACSDLGIQLYQKGEKEKAMEITLKSCQDGAALGCYNAACYYCLTQKKDFAMIYLEKSKLLGYDNIEWALKDTDLKCLHHSDQFQIWLDSFKKGQIQRSLSPYHLNFSQFGFSMQVPQGFEFNFGHPLEFYHLGGLRMQVYVASLAPYDLILATENQIDKIKQEGEIKIVKDEQLIVNTWPYRHIIYQFKKNQDLWTTEEVITGIPSHSIRATLTYPEKASKEDIEMSSSALSSIIIHPDFKPSLAKLDFNYRLPPTFSFAGITPQNELIFSPGGKTISLDGKSPYLTLSQMDFEWNEKDFNFDEFYQGLFQLFPPYYLPPVLNKPEVVKGKNKIYVISHGIISYPSLYFKIGLVLMNKKVYVLKHFSQDVLVNENFQMKKWLESITKP
jgi:hypothetical protein